MEFGKFVSEQRCRECPPGDSYIVLVNHSGDMVCSECGIVVCSRFTLDTPEWNNYSSERESGKNNSRVGWRDRNHPENTLGSRIGRIPKTNYLDKNLIMRQIYNEKSSKEKKYDYMSKEFDQYLNSNQIYGLNKRVITHAKALWQKLFSEKGVIFRGRHRKGIICVCVYKAAMQYTTLLMQDILKILNISYSEFTKALKVFDTHFRFVGSGDDNNKKCIKENLLKNQNTNDTADQTRNVFEIKMNILKLPYLFFVPTCTKVYVKCLKECNEFLDKIEKSRIASVIYFTLTLRDLHKKYLKQILKICDITKPTLIKAYNVIKNHFSEEDIKELIN